MNIKRRTRWDPLLQELFRLVWFCLVIVCMLCLFLLSTEKLAALSHILSVDLIRSVFGAWRP